MFAAVKINLSHSNSILCVSAENAITGRNKKFISLLSWKVGEDVYLFSANYL